MKLRDAGLGVLASVAVGAAAFGQSEPPPERWRVDHGEVNCTMSRTIRATQTTVLIRTVPGTTLSKLLLSSRAWADSPLRAGETVTVQLGDSAPVEVRAGAMRLESGTYAIGFQEIPPDHLDRLAAGGEIRIRRGRDAKLHRPAAGGLGSRSTGARRSAPAGGTYPRRRRRYRQSRQSGFHER